MASIIAGAAHTAHSTAASLLSSAEIRPGKTLPPLKVKETSPERAETVQLSGTTIIVRASSRIVQAKGVTGIYVVAVNDQFVMNAWKEKLAPKGTPIHFLADDQGEFAGATGLIFDATPLLGGPRSKRYVMIVKNQEVASVAVEEDPGKVTITDAKTILAQL